MRQIMPEGLPIQSLIVKPLARRILRSGKTRFAGEGDGGSRSTTTCTNGFIPQAGETGARAEGCVRGLLMLWDGLRSDEMDVGQGDGKGGKENKREATYGLNAISTDVSCISRAQNCRLAVGEVDSPWHQNGRRSKKED
jgi:hypothetical protein